MTEEGLFTNQLGRRILLPGCWNCLSPERRKSSFLSCPRGGGWLGEGIIIGLRVPACGKYIQFIEGSGAEIFRTTGWKGEFVLDFVEFREGGVRDNSVL
jgi:hypothetical protein